MTTNIPDDVQAVINEISTEPTDIGNYQNQYKINSITNKYSNSFSPNYKQSIQMGQLAGHSMVLKFGDVPDFKQSDAPLDVWDFGKTYIHDANGTAPIAYISSASSADVGQTIVVNGLDINGVFVSQTILTNGQNNVTLVTPLWRVFRLYNNSADGLDLDGVLYCHTDVAPTAGVPLESKTRAIISVGRGQTLMCLYTIPKGFVGFLHKKEIGTRRDKSGSMEILYSERTYGKCWRVKKSIAISNNGTSLYTDIHFIPIVLASLTDLKLTVNLSDKDDMGVFGTFDIELIDETLFTVAYLQSIGQVGY